MNEKQLANWLEVNHHKFVFYSYAGGTGGEFICTYLTEHCDFYNKDALKYATPYLKKPDLYDPYNTKVTNRYNFVDPLLYSALSHGFRTGEDLVQDVTAVNIEADTFKELAKSIMAYIKREGYSSLDTDLLNAFAKQDKKYLIRLHRILPYMKLFDKSKIYVVKADRFYQYTSLLVETKSLLAPVYTYNDKVNLLRISHRYYKNEKPLEEHMSYLEPILDNENVPLYEYTVQVIMNPETFSIDVSSLTIWTLQKMLWQFIAYRHLADKYRTDINEMVSYLETYHSEWVKDFNINLVKFEDVFLGTWANEEFGISKEDFYNTMIRWDQRNTLYLKRLGIPKPPRTIKRLNQELYSDDS